MGAAAPPAPAASPALAPLRPVAGFEASGYAWCGAELVFLGKDGRRGAAHPRNLLCAWRPAARRRALDPTRLHAGARAALARLRQAGAPAARNGSGAHGLLPWLLGRPLAFPLQAAAPRLNALAAALQGEDATAFECAALRLLGLGPGLTPSGDDLLGGIVFALHFAPRARWAERWPQVLAALRAASADVTNVISATLLGDLMQGIGYRALHGLIDALHAGAPSHIDAAIEELCDIGATSGGDLLAGVLLALSATAFDTTTP
jgi:hypothetical protein